MSTLKLKIKSAQFAFIFKGHSKCQLLFLEIVGDIDRAKKEQAALKISWIIIESSITSIGRIKVKPLL